MAVSKTCQVDYVIIGCIAASVWGRPRLTLDADVVLVINEADIAQLMATFHQHGFLISPSSRRHETQAVK